MTDSIPASVETMIDNLEKSRRVGWARAFAAEAALAELQQVPGNSPESAPEVQPATTSTGRLEELERLYDFQRGVLDVLAPSLHPYLKFPGIESFDGVEQSDSQNRAVNRLAGERAASRYLAASEEVRRNRDWRAGTLSRWSSDPLAWPPRCHCGCLAWDHSGPDRWCLKCDHCIVFRVKPNDVE